MTCHYYKDKYGNIEKLYVIVFVCALPGSGHIEITMHASAEVFTNSFDRFCSKNRVPEKTISDQGSNFKAFNTELKVMSNNELKVLSLMLSLMLITGIYFKIILRTCALDRLLKGYIHLLILISLSVTQCLKDRVEQPKSSNIQCRPNSQAVQVANTKLGQMSSRYTFVLNFNP